MDTSLARRCWIAIQELDSNASGSLAVTADSTGRVRVTGRLSTALMPPEKLVQNALHGAGIADDPLVLLTADDLQVVVSLDGETSTSHPSSCTPPHRWTAVLYQGMLPTTSIASTTSYKRVNPETKRKIANCLAELGAFVPIVLDPQLRVIDGELRLDLARRLEVSEVPVIVFDVTEAQAAFLRLVLNRSAEFQSWRHDEVGELVDTLPNLQPLLEPLGFFGTRLLPVSYFSKNLIDYYIDSDNVAQQRYRQELGLEEWAQVQRERILEAERARTNAPWMPSIDAPKLFELADPAADDFLATYDPVAELEAVVQQAKEMAFHANRLNNDPDEDA